MTESVQGRSRVIYANYSIHTTPHSVTFKEGLNFYLFRLQAEGTCRARVGGQIETIIPGDLLIYPPHAHYELTVQPRRWPESGEVQPVGDYFLAGDGEWLDAWWKDKSLPVRTNIGFDDKVISLWKHLISEKNAVHDQAEIMDYLLRALSLTLEQAIRTRRRTKGADTAHKIKLFIDNHAHEPLNLEHISASVGLSVSRCSFLFKSAFDQSLFAYCIDVRLKLAQQQVLYGNLTLEKVAENTGFQSYAHFSRVFRERFAHPPGEYRRKFGMPFNCKMD